MDQVQARIDIMNWITSFVEKPSPLLNGWPPCPYARRARLDGRIKIESGNTPQQDLHHWCRRGLGELDVVVLFYDPTKWPLQDFRQAWMPCQELLGDHDLYVLEDHPEDVEMVKNVCMNQGNWALLLLQSKTKLEEASNQLMQKNYYHGWDDQYLQALFKGRKDPRK